MPSTLTWLDYSEEDRRRAVEVIKLFEEKDTVDELGIGTIRDALAEQLFPGTSVIQSRPRYFLIIPWIYLALEAKKTPSAEVAAQARKLELGLIEPLLVAEDHRGVLGSRARTGLKTLPSAIYWAGLGRWSIRLFPGTRDKYHRSLDTTYRSLARMARDGTERELADRPAPRNWHAGLPAPPDDFPEKASIQLRAIEGEYLRERVLTSAPDSLLSFLLERGKPMASIDFPWQHPQCGELPSQTAEVLHHARLFSEAMHGAALIYNDMLAEKRKDEELLSTYEQRLQNWAALMAEREPALRAWDRQRFWMVVQRERARVPITTRMFVDQWLDFGAKTGWASLSRSSAVRGLIREREVSLKRGLARLTSQRALDLWEGASGAKQLDFRWKAVAQDVVNDITGALQPEVGTHA